jgi:hypothetical protein
VAETARAAFGQWPPLKGQLTAGEDGGSEGVVEGDADVYADGDDEHVRGDVSSCFFDLFDLLAQSQ